MADQIKHVATFQDGVNTVFAREAVPPTQAKRIINCNILSTAKGDTLIITNVRGTLLVSTPLPAGENKSIGVATDNQERLKFYIFNWNENGYHTIFEYNHQNRVIIPVLQSITDTGGFDVLKFSKDYLILMNAVVRNKLLYWVDGLNPARKINILKALDKSDAGYGQDISEDFINAYKLGPDRAPVAVYTSDVSKGINTLYGSLRKFVSRFIYDDGEKSQWSDYSNVPLPPKEAYTGVNTIPTDNNCILITVPTGSKIVMQVEIAMQSTDQSADLVLTPWVSIAVLNKKKLSIPDNNQYTYKFYNDGSYPATLQEKVEKPYSFMPDVPLCMAYTRKAHVYGNFEEGFETVQIDTSVQVTYEDLFIDPGTENNFNTPSFVAEEIPNSGDFLKYHRFVNNAKYVALNGEEKGVTATRLANAHKVTVGNDVKLGNVFSMSLTNGGFNFKFSYTAGLNDTATTVANAIKKQIVATDQIIRQSKGNVSPPEHYIYTNVNDGLGNISFSFVILDYYDNGYFKPSASVTPVQFNSLKDTGQSILNPKLGAGVKFGIVYRDGKGRKKSLVYTEDALITHTQSENELGGLKAAVFTITVKHTPPIWAVQWEIVRSRDLTYNNFIQMLIQKVIDVPATDATNGDYLDLVVGSLFTYQKIHPNTTLAYEFKKGDRIRFKTREDKTYYPFTETEVLSYKTETVEDINSNLVVNGTDTITVAAASIKNVGRYILVDNNEREIIAAPSATTYTLNSLIGNSGSPQTFLSYQLVDRRGLLRIRKPNGITLTDNSVMEVFSPSLSGDALGQKQFYHFNKIFDIINPGLANRYHSANQQNQGPGQDAIVRVTEGTVYVRNREMPVTNSVPGAQIVVNSVEDQSYSDFYYSRINDNGRDNIEDDGKGRVSFPERLRYSNIDIEDTLINGLNDFDNLDREDYNDKYGAFKLLVYTEGQIMAFKDQKDCIIPVFQTVIQDDSGQNLLATSTKMLNSIRYYGHEGGIGNNPESYSSNGLMHYHASANSAVLVRLGGDGATPISEVYEIDNEVRELLASSAKNNTRIYGGYDRYFGAAVFAFTSYKDKSYNGGFSLASWNQLSPELPDGSTFEILTMPAHGTLTVMADGQALYAAAANYTGPDNFTYRVLVDGVWKTRKACITVEPPVNRETGWRQQLGSWFCVLNQYGGQTGYKGWATLEEFYLDDSTLTGNTKANSPSGPDYVEPIVDESACVPSGVPVTINYNVSRHINPFVDGNVSLQKNGSTTDLITFIGTGTSSGDYKMGDILTANAFHYHTGFRWPNDASLTMTITDSDGTVVFTYTGGAVNIADVVSHSLTLIKPSYTVFITTFSADSSLVMLSYDLINNNPDILEGEMNLTVKDSTNSLTMLSIQMPGFEVARSGVYNMKSDVNPQIPGITISPSRNTNIRVQTQGGYDQTFHIIGSSGAVTLPNIPKSGIIITLSPYTSAPAFVYNTGVSDGTYEPSSCTDFTTTTVYSDSDVVGTAFVVGDKIYRDPNLIYPYVDSAVVVEYLTSPSRVRYGLIRAGGEILELILINC